MLSYLIVGTGMMGKIIAPIIRQSGQFVGGVVELDKAVAETFISENNLTHAEAYGGKDGVDVALNSGNFDVVAILVPNCLHSGMAIKAAGCGKHLLIEKPLAITSTDAREVLDKIVEAGVAAEIDSQYRYHELVDQKLRQMINSGELGKPVYISVKYLQDWQMNPADDIGWRPVVDVAGRGKLVGDLGSHVLQTTLHLFGGRFDEFDGQTYNVYPVRYKLKAGAGGTFSQGVPGYREQPDLYEEMDMLSQQYSGDDIATARFTLETEKNVRVAGDFTLSQVHPGHKNDFSFDIAFEKGSVSWRAEQPNHMFITSADGVNQRVERASDPGVVGRPPGHPQGYGDAILLELLNFHKVIETGDKENIRAFSKRNIGQAVHAVELVEKWLESPMKSSGR